MIFAGKLIEEPRERVSSASLRPDGTAATTKELNLSPPARGQLEHRQYQDKKETDD